MRRVFFLAAVLLVAAAAVLFWARMRYEQPYKGYGSADIFVEIPPGTPVPAIGRRLVDAGVVRDQLSFRYAVWKTGAGRRLQAGEYRFDRPMTAVEVVEKLARGDVYQLSLTIREGLTIRDMAALFEKAGLGPAAAFERAALRRELVAELDPLATDLEGYLFPDTYLLSRRATADHLVELMVQRFLRAFDEPLRQEAAARGYSVREAVTLASIVEKETGRSDERPLVAAVYTNRLRSSMGLQCDPTIIYVLQRAGKWNGNLRKEDLLLDSPYNTYRFAGLPPGPIASPGRASLEAAIHPADAPYLYFVSRNDGSHAFATTLQEHNANVRVWQKDYFKDRTK